jgi:probable rRNA maturation factor
MDSDTEKQGIIIDINQDNPELEKFNSDIEKLIREICSDSGIEKADISLSVVGDERITEINRQFLEHNYSTDVISFDLSDTGSKNRVFDIVVNWHKAERKASEFGHPFFSELALYITHGLLHNLGFDDGTEQQAKQMHDTEDRILRKYGYGNIYKGAGN